MKNIALPLLLLVTMGCEKLEKPIPEQYFNPDAVRIEITSPADGDTVQLQDEDFFPIEGSSSGFVESSFDLEIYILVYPIDPFGGGWYVQQAPGQAPADGSWFAQPHFGGQGGFEAESGDIYNIAAIVTCDQESIAEIIQRDTPRVESLKELPTHQISGFVTNLVVMK